MRHFLFAATLAIAILIPTNGTRAAEIRAIEFPVNDTVSFHDDFGAPRSGGRVHEGTDMLGKKMMPLVSAIDGRVDYLVDPEESWGYAIVLEDSEGYTYHYLHVNNDSPGTDDDLGGTQNAYAPGIVRGARVTKGQLIGWMGDSGNAESVSPHLHFEIRRPDGTAINAYQSLVQATRSGRYDPAAEIIASPNINADRGLDPDPAVKVYCVNGWLIKSPISTAVYYCGADGKRYVFPTQKTYNSWYQDFSEVHIISVEELALVPLGKNITYRPGTKLIKIQTDPKVYAIGRGGELRWVTTTDIAAKLYGKDWVKKIDDLSDVFFTNYELGDPIVAAP